MNLVFYALVLLSFLAAARGVANAGPGDPDVMAAVAKGALDGAKSSVELAISLAGAMTLFLGLMKVVEQAGLLDGLARVIRPVMVRLFPDVPAEHPAMGAMIMNISANVLGLGNAATPFGIRAMQELDKLNKQPGTATNAMVLFLAINTSGVAVLPTGVIAMRASLGSTNPAAIFATTLFATSCSTISAVIVTKLVERFFPLSDPPERHATSVPLTAWIPFALLMGGLVSLVTTVYVIGERASSWIVPGLIVAMLSAGVVRKVKVYEAFIEGARDGFTSATRIIPYLVAILTSVGMFRASGAMDSLVQLFNPLTSLIGFPAEVLPLALLRPLSGSGAFALATELTKTHGPDSFVGQLAGTLNGSMETTFYVLAVYFGAVSVMRTRHAALVGVIADIMGALGSLVAVRLLLGGP